MNYKKDRQPYLSVAIATVGLMLTTPVIGQEVSPKAEIDELREQLKASQLRIDQLEESVFDVSEKLGSRTKVSAFEAVKLDIGGFLHAGSTFVNSDSGSANSFNRMTFGLLIGAEIGENWTAFIGQASNRESDIQFQGDGGPNGIGARTDPTFDLNSTTPLVLAWTNYKHNDALNIRFGRFVTPHGIINIEHFPALLLDPEQPQFLRPFRSDTIMPNFVQGIQATGKTFWGSNTVEYYVYTGNFAETGDELTSGVRGAFTLGDTGLTFGLNGSEGERRDRPTVPADAGGDYNLFGADVLYDKGAFQVKAEYFTTDETDAEDREAYYIQPAWRFAPKWTAFYRYDFLDDGNETGDSVENVLGINFQPISPVRLRASYTMREIDRSDRFNLPSADIDIVQLSATVSF